MKNLYEILEVNENASKDVIDKVYKVLAKKYHPDLQTSEQAKIVAEEKMKEINEAYSILSDNEKRAKYNQKLQNERVLEKNRNNANYSVNTSNIYANTYSSQNNNSEQVNNSPNSKMEKNLKKKQKKLEKELKKKMEDAYLKAYGDYLRKNGYRVKYRFDYSKLPALLGSIIIVMIIGCILWFIPITHNYLVKIYEENEIVKFFIDIIINIFNNKK